ncbi:uncharacterized protein LOC143024788 isoform X2 [Oratosquilla oratoria]|uniref:uncharacterized protein LOC143024788 isoform X2 n=1 Tax=Oratosquilla oratoria TaxID=337810 RepID=UPI003F770D0F
MADVKELQSKLEQTPKEDLHHISVNDALIRRYLRAFKKVDIAYEHQAVISDQEYPEYQLMEEGVWDSQA